MRKNFTKIVMLAVAGLFSIGGAFAQVGGIGWGNVGIGEYPLVINENFQNWPKTHSVASQEIITAGGAASVSSAWQTASVTIPVYNNDTDTGRKFALHLYNCAVAPDFYTQYTLDDSKQDFPKNLISKGFVELGRTTYAPVAPGSGELIIPKIDELEGIQYAYSSVGGVRRGFKLFKKEEGIDVDWVLVRNETGNANTSTSGTNVQASGYGLRFEELLSMENVSLKFTISDDTQIFRLHDLKVYGVIADGNTSIEQENGASFKIRNTKQEVSLTANADVEIYSTTGTLVKAAQNVTTLNIADLSSGVYVVKAISVEGVSLNKKIVK